MRARELWALAEPLHAVVYFAPEVRAAADRAGMPGFWSGYFGMRAAPLGQPGAAAVAALFHGFAPSFVARWVPSVWEATTPAEALGARAAGTSAALRRVLGADAGRSDLAEAAGLARRAAEAVQPVGRALAAGEQQVVFPGEPVGDLWQALTTLREHRGDGHVTALLWHDLDGLEAHVLRAAASGVDREWLLRARGWTAAEWDAAAGRLAARGVLTDGGLTAAGRALRDEVEEATDRLAGPPWTALAQGERARLAELLLPLRRAVVAAGLFPPGNPIGVPDQD